MCTSFNSMRPILHINNEFCDMTKRCLNAKYTHALPHFLARLHLHPNAHARARRSKNAMQQQKEQRDLRANLKQVYAIACTPGTV